jgi:hypothetical protein
VYREFREAAACFLLLYRDILTPEGLVSHAARSVDRSPNGYQ